MTPPAMPPPGVHYGVSFDAYAAWDATHKTALAKIAETSPAQYLHDLANPKHPSREMIVGDAVDLLLFGGDAALRARYFAQRYRAGSIDYHAAVWKAGDLIPLSKADWERVHDIARAVRASRDAMELLDGARFQVSLLWEHSSGIMVKCRPDIVPPRPPRLGDLKVTHDVSTDGFRRTGRRLRYGWQGALYCHVMSALTDEEWTEFSFVTVRDQPVHTVQIHDMDPGELFEFRIELEEWIELHAKCKSTGVWPDGPGRSTITFGRTR